MFVRLLVQDPTPRPTCSTPSIYSTNTSSFSLTVLVYANAINLLANITVCSFTSCKSAFDHRLFLEILVNGRLRMTVS